MEEELNLQVKFLKTCGFFKDPPEKYKKLLTFFVMSTIFCLSYVVITMIVFTVKNYTDVFMVAECLGPVISAIVALVKIGFLLLYSKEIFGMIDEIKELNGRWKKTPHYVIIENANNFDRLVLKGMIFAVLFSGVAAVVPIIKNIINVLVLNKEWETKLPYKAVYFYDITAFPEYHLTYLVQCDKIYFSAIVTTVVDTIFFGLCMNICAHFEILRNVVLEMELKEFVIYHRNLIDLASRMNTLYKFVIFSEYIILSVFLCVNAFQVVMSDDMARVFVAAFFGVAGFLDLWMYSYGGQRIMDAALEVTDDCYIMNREYVYVILRAQQEIKIESYTYHASLPTLTTILNQTMSLITMLQSFVKN